jgi:zinc transporter 1/2/3
MIMGDTSRLSDFIEVCLSHNLPKEKLVTLLKESIQSGIRRLDEDPCDAENATKNDVSLQIATVFIILVASSLGVAFPLLAKYNERLNIHHFYIVLGKCVGTGVILSCALIHMIQPSTEALTSECLPKAFEVYPAFSFFFALVAALSMHLFEFLLTRYISGDGELEETKEVTEKNQNVDDSCELADIGEGQKVDYDDQQLARNAEEEKLMTQRISQAYMLEFGVSAHSVFIGLSVGVTSEKSELITLLVALIFHQMFEGIALGSRLSDATLGIWNEVLLGAVFAVSAPVGIAMGIGMYTTMNTNSDTFLITTGVLDGLCGGILLYTGFVFLLEDFSSDMRKCCHGKNQRLMEAGMFTSLWVSALLMAAIGLYL